MVVAALPRILAGAARARTAATGVARASPNLARAGAVAVGATGVGVAASIAVPPAVRAIQEPGLVLGAYQRQLDFAAQHPGIPVPGLPSGAGGAPAPGHGPIDGFSRGLEAVGELLPLLMLGGAALLLLTTSKGGKV